MTQFERLTSMPMEEFVNLIFNKTCPSKFGLKDRSQLFDGSCHATQCHQCFIDAFSEEVKE